jgi:hypothetical protein
MMAGLVDPDFESERTGVLSAPSRAVGGLLDYAYNYSPHTQGAMNRLGELARILMESASPAGDMVGMKESSRDTWGAIRDRNLAGTLANGGMTAAAVPMMFLPGTTKSVRDAAASPEILDQLARLLRGEIKQAPIGELSPAKLAELSKVVPADAAAAFAAADPRISAKEELVSSLRDLRKEHADRLIMRLPELLGEGLVRPNYQINRLDRPLFTLESPIPPSKPGSWDVMILDASGQPGTVQIPTVMTAPERTLKKKP